MFDPKLATYIQRFRSKGNDTTSHVALVRPFGRYCISFQKMDDFMEMYCERISKGNFCALAEIPNTYCMLVVDVDLAKKTEIKDNETIPTLHTYDDIEDLVRIYQQAVKNNVRDCQDKHLECAVLRKKPYYIKGKIKHGFHLAFINLFISRAARDVYINDAVKKELNNTDLFSHLGYETPDKVLDLDKGSKDKPWLMYGSGKSVDSGTYTLERIYDSNMSWHNIDYLLEYKVFDCFGEDIELEEEEDIIYNLPRILSINPNSRECAEIINKTRIINNVLMRDHDHPIRNYHTDEELTKEQENNLQLAEELIDMVNDFRADDHNMWKEIGWILRSISNGHRRGLELWINFSARCPSKFNETSCIQEWDNMFSGNYTISALKKFADEDNPSRYKKFRDANVQKRLYEAVNQIKVMGTHNDLAKALFEEYGENYVCVYSSGRPIWFHFHGHVWHRCESDMEIRDCIPFLIKKFSEIRRQLYEQHLTTQEQSEDEARDTQTEEQALKKKLEFVSTVISSLKNHGFKNCVVKECQQEFYDKEFLKKLGQNKYLIAAKNGVLDFRTFEFRDGRADDYIELQMNVNYRPCSMTDQWMIEVKDYLHKVFVNDELRQYFIDITSSILIGGNSRKHIYVCSGPLGNNAKSLTQKMIETILGPYSCKIPTSILTGKKTSSGQACPELARTGSGARMVVADESSSKESFNCSSIKLYSGSDSFFVRFLYDNGKEITPMFKMFIICNALPRLDVIDPAVMIRLRVLMFESRFEDDAPEDLDEQIKKKIFPKDELFSEKIPFMVEPLFYLLVENLHDLMVNRGGKIHEPEEVKNATHEYQKKNDVIAQFIYEKMTHDEDGSFSLTEFYTEFQEWFRETFPGRSVMERADVDIYLNRTLSDKLKGHRYYGFRMRSRADDVADGRVVEITADDLADDKEDYEHVNPLVGGN
jgi:P4 family phage/plasmid primase-like protien